MSVFYFQGRNFVRQEKCKSYKERDGNLRITTSVSNGSTTRTKTKTIRLKQREFLLSGCRSNNKKARATATLNFLQVQI